MKLCRKCMIEKESDEFYQREQSSNGLSSYCRVCTRKAVLEWRAKYPNKRRAHVLVANALKWGELIRPNKCSKCNNERMVVAHHPDYNRPLEVIWVCESCHVKIHKGVK